MPQTAAIPAGDRVGWRLVAAALGLSIAGASAPIAVAMAATSGLLGPPAVASALVALLVLAPGGVGLATALSGLRGVAAVLSARAAADAEQAVMRVLAGALIFGHSLALAAATPSAGATPEYLAVAAFGLITAWTLLLHIILWPVFPPLRRFGAMLLDVALLSAFLHYGGGAVAGWYPLYLLAIVYAGFRFGLGTLWWSASLGILGFAAVFLSTEFWRQQPALAAGLILAPAVLAWLTAGSIRTIAAARQAAAEAKADRRQVLELIGGNLRGPLARIGAALAPGGTLAGPHPPDDPAAAAARAIRLFAARINDVLDLAALEAGAFAPPSEAFDLRALVKRSLVPLQADAAQQGVALSWRIDPHLPVQLRGRAQALARLLAGLAGHAVKSAERGMVRVALDTAARDARWLQLRLVVEHAGDPEPDLAQSDAPLALRLVERLVALMGGGFGIEPAPGRRIRLTATLPLAIEEGAAEPVLDLGSRPVLIATEDETFASELAEPLAAWNGDVGWVGDADSALAVLTGGDASERAVMIVDGRRKLLWAFSLAHRAARIGDGAPFVLMVADTGQIESLGEVDEGEVDGFIPLPVSDQLLANALQALPLGPFGPLGPPMPERVAAPFAEPAPPPADPPGLSEGPQEPFGERVTPIAAHPKFMPETAPALDMRAIDGLRALGGDPGFLDELIETFQADALQILERLDQAVAAADAAGFAQGLITLRRAASPLGGTRLCELLASLQGLTAKELRQLGAIHVQRLAAEIDRLVAALTEFLPASEARLL